VDPKELDLRFTHHAPKSEYIYHFQNIRRYARNFADMVNDSLPYCREKSLALTKIEEAVMWANAGIARKGARKDAENP
jgi:hypothetical protein